MSACDLLCQTAVSSDLLRGGGHGAAGRDRRADSRRIGEGCAGDLRGHRGGGEPVRARGEAPGQEIVEGMMLAMAGVLLVIPGFVTDFMGLLLLTPLTRRPIAALVFKRMQLRVIAGLQGGMHAGFHANQGPFGAKSQDPFGQGDDRAKKDGNVFEGDFEHKDDPSDIKPVSHQIPNSEQDKDPKP